MKRTPSRKRRRSPFGRFANHIEVKPTCTEITLTLGHFHAETGDDTIEWAADPVGKFTLPYAAAKVAAFNLLAVLAAVEHKGGFVSVPPGIRPEMPAAEYLGPEATARIATLFAELFSQPEPPKLAPALAPDPSPHVTTH